MTSKECLKRIDERNYLTQRERKEFLSVIEKDLDRLEKLEKVLEILKERGGIHLYINRNNDNKLTLDFDDCISCILEPREYELLKEVLENE